MTSNILYAYLHRNPVGRFIRQSKGNISFIYNDDYRRGIDKTYADGMSWIGRS